jgi:hypothetical protein
MRNPGLTARLAPDFVSLNPGYRPQNLIIVLRVSVTLLVMPTGPPLAS